MSSVSNDYVGLPGIVVSVERLRLGQAIAMVEAVTRNPYCRLIECRQTDSGREFVVFDTDVEVGQSRVHDIRQVERIAVAFTAKDHLPAVLALREGFPQVPHLNFGAAPPRSLCLFDEPPEEARLNWTTPRVVERIRQWLALTAKGKLHADDQPLEPLLAGSLWQLVVPHDLFLAHGPDEFLVVGAPIDSGNGLKTFIAARPTGQPDPANIHSVATLVTCEPQTHGIITAAPASLAELHDFLRAGNVDLISELRARFKTWRAYASHILSARLILIVQLPKTREGGSPIEAYEYRAFLSDASIREIGIDIGLWAKVDGKLGDLLLPDQTQTGIHTSIKVLMLHFAFSRDMATRLSGLVSEEHPKICLVGAGALGSQLFINLARMGYGDWSLVDDDLMLPHNLGRHALTEGHIGQGKAGAVASLANRMLADDKFAEGLVANALLSATDENVTRSFENADVILDASTSIPVARHLVHDISTNARRISVYLNPLGTDLVILAEDQQRQVWLDALEMQYYRALIHEAQLEDHVRHNDGRLRYASGCRDISITVPQDLVALHSAISSRALRQILSESGASISVWRCDPREISVSRYRLPVAPVAKYQVGAWTLCTDQWVLDKIHRCRSERLPNETGGVLLGSYDMQRRIIYVVDTILSPLDSQEWPTVYIRGCEGLRPALDRVASITSERLHYVGEWHSHPDGVRCLPSAADRQAINWLAQIMDLEGLPPLMLIAGENGESAFYAGEMVD